jgi:hypothetical protein
VAVLQETLVHKLVIFMIMTLYSFCSDASEPVYLLCKEFGKNELTVAIQDKQLKLYEGAEISLFNITYSDDVLIVANGASKDKSGYGKSYEIRINLVASEWEHVVIEGDVIAPVLKEKCRISKPIFKVQ